MKYLIYIILFILILFNIYRLGQNSVSPSIIEKIDTITKIDTVVVYKPVKDTVYLTKYITDTLYTTDSIKTPVNVPISTTIYKDSTYYAQISGFKASLDTLMVFPKETIIYKEKTLEIKEKPPLIKHRYTSWNWVFTCIPKI
jgi:hypothetical protein